MGSSRVNLIGWHTHRLRVAQTSAQHHLHMSFPEQAVRPPTRWWRNGPNTGLGKIEESPMRPASVQRESGLTDDCCPGNQIQCKHIVVALDSCGDQQQSGVSVSRISLKIYSPPPACVCENGLKMSAKNCVLNNSKSRRVDSGYHSIDCYHVVFPGGRVRGIDLPPTHETLVKPK